MLAIKVMLVAFATAAVLYVVGAALSWLGGRKPPPAPSRRDLVERLQEDIFGDGEEAAEEIVRLRAENSLLRAELIRRSPPMLGVLARTE